MAVASDSVCSDLKQGCLPIWQALHDHPFVREAAAGTLPLEKFRFYVEQNLMYLQEYSRAIAIGVARSRDLAELESFTVALGNIVDSEIDANEARLAEAIEQGAEDRGGTLEMAPANVAYTSFLMARAFKGGPLEIMTTIMPCAWSYRDIALELMPGSADHPIYSKWLGYFAGEQHRDNVSRMRDELEELARRQRVDEAGLIETFKMGARLELGFWDMAYGMVQWADLKAEE